LLVILFLRIVHITHTKNPPTMQTVNISDFRANLLKYLEKANAGEQISVTTNGKLLATITPPLDQKKFARQALMQLAKTATIHDVVNPTEADWGPSL